MKQIPKKNYAILCILIVGTIFLTLMLANIYISKNRLVSQFYENSNKLDSKELEEYMTENSDVIIYIADKYDLNYEAFEKKLESKLESLNLKDKLVYIDKKEINSNSMTNLKNSYQVVIDLEKTPILIFIVDNQVIKSILIENNTDVNSVINYEVFE